MATHSSIRAWGNPWTEEPGRLQSMGSQRVKHNNDFHFHQYTIYRRRQWQPTPVLLSGKSHGRRSLVSCSPWGHEESDTTERLHFHFSLSCIGRKWQPTPVFLPGESRDRGAWWAAVYGVSQSRTQLTRLSSSSSSILYKLYVYMYI